MRNSGSGASTVAGADDSVVACVLFRNLQRPYVSRLRLILPFVIPIVSFNIKYSVMYLYACYKRWEASYLPSICPVVEKVLCYNGCPEDRRQWELIMAKHVAA